jgi:hypothetical protein
MLILQKVSTVSVLYLSGCPKLARRFLYVKWLKNMSLVLKWLPQTGAEIIGCVNWLKNMCLVLKWLPQTGAETLWCGSVPRV